MPSDCCHIKGCENTVFCSKLCSKHYTRTMRYGSADTIKKPQRWNVPCSVDQCGRKVKGHGYCSLHYQRYKKYGDATKTLVPPPRKNPHTFVKDGIGYLELTKGAYAKVDPEELTRLSEHCWQLNAYGYAARIVEKPKRHGLYMHHAIIGRPTNGFVTDHLNRDRLDNRKHNLRHVTPADNTRNSAVAFRSLPL